MFGTKSGSDLPQRHVHQDVTSRGKSNLDQVLAGISPAQKLQSNFWFIISGGYTAFKI